MGWASPYARKRRAAAVNSGAGEVRPGGPRCDDGELLGLGLVGGLGHVLGRADAGAMPAPLETTTQITRGPRRRFGSSLNSPLPVWTTRPSASFDSAY